MIFETPVTFEAAWNSNFFSATALLLITGLGFIVDTIPLLHKLPLGGRLKHCKHIWSRVCQSVWVNDVISEGYKIPFKFEPCQTRVPANPTVSGPAYDVLVAEATELLAKEAVAPVAPDVGQYVSSYFAVPKPRSPGKFRPILNLKKFNKSIKHYKFKMEGLRQVRDWIQPNAFMCGMDLKDAFLHIPINKRFWRYLRFSWLGSLLEWRVLPFGLKCSPRVITKVLRPVMAYLRATWSILISIYIDDLILQASSAEKVFLHAQVTALLLMVLGWSLNWKKSDFVPKQQVIHLGFMFDTQTMTISCPADKVMRLQSLCRPAMSNGIISVHNAERMLGLMESVRPVTPLAALHYRSIQKQLLRAKSVVRKPDQIIHLSRKSILSLSWWLSPAGFAANASSPIRELEPTVEIWTDANKDRGGAHSSRGAFMQRAWSSAEQELHINLLETRAAREAVAHLAEPGDRVRLHIDNRTATAYIRRQGGTKSSSVSQEACQLWEEVVSRDIVLLTPHWIPTKSNVLADFLSRHDMDNWELCLDRNIFTSVVEHFSVYPSLDAFASHWSAQLPRYMSWYRDSQAVAQDALLNPWDQITYLFPPVPLLPRVIRKVREEKIRALLICPYWPTALWWGLLVDMLVEPPMALPHYRIIMTHYRTNGTIPYLDPLVALHLHSSGKHLL